ncbi:endo-1,4-beta-xylanase, partial [Nonomuraea sp. NPDC003201]
MGANAIPSSETRRPLSGLRWPLIVGSLGVLAVIMALMAPLRADAAASTLGAAAAQSGRYF